MCWISLLQGIVPPDSCRREAKDCLLGQHWYIDTLGATATNTLHFLTVHFSQLKVCESALCWWYFHYKEKLLTCSWNVEDTLKKIAIPFYITELINRYLDIPGLHFSCFKEIKAIINIPLKCSLGDFSRSLLFVIWPTRLQVLNSIWSWFGKVDLLTFSSINSIISMSSLRHDKSMIKFSI